MAYFLKKTKLKGRTYLSIDESFYNHEKKGTSHKCYKSLGSVETWIEKGIPDPVAYFQKEVDDLNREKEREGIRKISDASSAWYLGYFPLKAILEKLKIKKYMESMELQNGPDGDVYELLSFLIYALAIYPINKQIPYYEIFPNLYETTGYSYDQLTDALSFFGRHYEVFVELFASRVSHVFGLDTSKTYFCYSDFFFGNVEEDLSSQKSSCENESGSIFGIRVLLDSHSIPFDIKIYPRNENEKPALQETVALMKSENHVDGRTVRMAGKGYSSARNVTFSGENKEGYLYVKSLQGLSQADEDWILQEEGFTEIRDKGGNLLYRYKSYIDDFPYNTERGGTEHTVKIREKHVLIYDPSAASKKRYEINRMVEKAKTLNASGARRSAYGQAGRYIHSVQGGNGTGNHMDWETVNRDLRLAGYTLFVTSETETEGTDIIHIHYDLRKIEYTFEFVKVCLETNLVSNMETEAIKGCFLISYLTALLERILQEKILGDEYSGTDITWFVRNFKVIKGETKYINITKSTDLIRDLAGRWKLPLTNYFLTETQIKAILKCKL